MALSYYSHQMDSDIAITDPELQALMNDAFNFDYLVDPTDLLYSENCNNSLDYHNLTTETPFFPQQQFQFEFEFDPSHYSKRQKPCDYQHIFNTTAPNPCLTMLQPPEFITPPQFLDFPAAGYSSGSCDKDLAPAPATGSVSAQSVAARQRRRRITEKTHELGKLVPGGQKMNTAEMLQSAYKYIKFLQAQVALLEFVGSTDKEVGEAPFEGEQVLHILLESPLIQEKLYSTENCLVPQKFVEELRLDEQIVESNPNLLPRLEKDH